MLTPNQAEFNRLLLRLSPIFVKEKQFGPDIFLLIVLLENRLEFNISIAPLELLPVRSPLWNVVVDWDGNSSNTWRLNMSVLLRARFDTRPVMFPLSLSMPR